MAAGAGSFPSPNYGPRRDGARPSLVVIHYTAMRDVAAARERLCDPAFEVSAHWLLDEAGRAEALVDEAARAWHAGAGDWGGQADVNSRSIGIEIAHPGDRPFPAAQMDGLERLLAGILARWSIPPEGVIAHSDMAPARKIDPGPRFDWRRLGLAGLAAWSDADGRDGAGAPDPTGFAADLDRIGYPQVAPALRLQAFRLRFRPWGQGALAAEDAARAAEIARRWPAARG